MVAQAKAIPGQLNGILRLHFCVWTDAETAWMTRATLEPALADYLQRACQENPRWNKGTVGGVRQVLPGLQTRGDANGEICEEWRLS